MDAPGSDANVQIVPPSEFDDSHVEALDTTPTIVNQQLIDSPAIEDNHVPLQASPDESEAVVLDTERQLEPNRQRINGPSTHEHRESVAGAASPADNRQRLESDSSNARRQTLPENPTSGRVFESAPRREAEVVLNRFYETWQASTSREPEVVRKKAGFPTEIPPTIHRQRVVDFSSLDIYLEYEHEKEHEQEESVEPHAATATPVNKKRAYDYKLRTCLDILKRQQDVVNEKLQRIQVKK